MVEIMVMRRLYKNILITLSIMLVILGILYYVTFKPNYDRAIEEYKKHKQVETGNGP
jgi:preprotein translocase subunit YajC